MLLPFLGYVFATTALAAVAVLLTGLVNTATLEKGRHHPTPVIAPKVKVEIQRHLPVAKKALSAKDDSPGWTACWRMPKNFTLLACR
jgi:hypothetical protein